jgi:uncharacterized protein
MKRSRVKLYFLFFLFLLHGCSDASGPRVCFDAECVEVELALTNEELRQGLQYRKSLGANKGMLFVFESPVKADFWMKHTLIPLDMIWMNKDKKIIYIQKNAPPCVQDVCPTYGPDQDVLFVLEVNAGYTDKHKIHQGDIASFYAMDTE